ncbi:MULTISPECIES: hypothetical protein [unclassified Pantoea]|uniref:hypothetical protein n=1 Tax=unclassified Pantoea TaxID=2630326 RepID=UPI0012328A86|nr:MULTISPECIES: hypothetical protein [unclassified Pantoea]KAA5932314.1 hypothetical protein F3I59_04605 [Pantoea sp. VH_8]KAA5937375.1 hypothetical protein F3I58_04635 [Pantoea sp. VH_4]
MKLSNLFNPKVLFTALIFLCVLALSLSFYSWNKGRPFSATASSPTENDIKYSIDSCNTHGGTLSVKGWIFNSNYPKSGNLIITFKGDESEYRLPLFTFTRGDVSQLFGRNDLFDKVGFNAAISNKLIKQNEKGLFNFYISDSEGNVDRVMTYECTK